MLQARVTSTPEAAREAAEEGGIMGTVVERLTAVVAEWGIADSLEDDELHDFINELAGVAA